MALTALASLAHALGLHVRAHVDCMAVEITHKQTAHKRLRPTSRYAGVWRSVMVLPGDDPIEAVHWTKAHRTDQVIAGLPVGEQAVALANKAADELAKDAVDRHPQQDREVLRDLDVNLRHARLVLQLAVKILPLFQVDKFDLLPKEQRPGYRSASVSAPDDAIRRSDPISPDEPDGLFSFSLDDDVRSGAVPAAAASCSFGGSAASPAATEVPRPTQPLSRGQSLQSDFLAVGHDLVGRQCSQCLLSPDAWLATGKGPCAGEHKSVKLNRANSLGHRLVRIHGSGVDRPCFFCVECGCHSSSNRVISLSAKCSPGCLGRTAGEALGRVRDGRHPDCKLTQSRIEYRSIPTR